VTSFKSVFWCCLVVVLSSVCRSGGRVSRGHHQLRAEGQVHSQQQRSRWRHSTRRPLQTQQCIHKRYGVGTCGQPGWLG